MYVSFEKKRYNAVDRIFCDAIKYKNIIDPVTVSFSVGKTEHGYEIRKN